jgi:glycosyltransferase involved in cell wall biosynthesis
VWRELRTFRPDIVMSGGFNPPMLAAFAYSRLTGARHIAVSDAWRGSEQGLSRVHRALRKLVYSRSCAFVGASEKTLDLFRQYGARGRLYKAPLSIDNEAFSRAAGTVAERPIDLIYVGRLIDLKLPMFFVDIVRRVAEVRPVRVEVVGDGPLRDAMEAAFHGVTHAQVHFTGYVRPAQLPALYARSKLLAFPTRTDAWGIVANEACATGTPVITCANAGCAGELVVDGVNGGVLALDPAIWAARIVEILGNRDLLSRLSESARASVADYTFDAAALAIVEACNACA